MTLTAAAQRTAAGYDENADLYFELFQNELDNQPLDRALMATFAESVLANDGPVADAGCGPGMVTAHLASLGLHVSGYDLAGDMLAIARRTYPTIDFHQADIAALPLGDATLAGLVARYSTIHTPPEDLPAVIAEFGRVLAPRGALFISFSASESAETHGESFDHTVATAYRWHPPTVIELLARNGIDELATLVAPVNPKRPHQRFPHVVVLGRRRGE